MITEITIGILGTAIGAAVVYAVLSKKQKSLQKKISELEHNLKSAYVKFGKSFEHFIPFSKEFPAEKQGTVFLGMPIDFISFGEDKIKFIEIKTGQSQLSNKQKRIKRQVEGGDVEFIELRY